MKRNNILLQEIKFYYYKNVSKCQIKFPYFNTSLKSDVIGSLTFRTV